ncbi:unnamed protein product, partial [Fusarium graminearum]
MIKFEGNNNRWYSLGLRLSAVDVPKIVLRSQCSLSTFDRYVCRNHLTPTGPAPRPARHFEDEAPQAATSIFQSRQSTRGDYAAHLH